MYTIRSCSSYIFALIASMGLHSVSAAVAQETVEQIWGCTSLGAINFNPMANVDDGSCIYEGLYGGCTDSAAINYDSSATSDDGSCQYEEENKDCEDALFRVKGRHGNFGKLTHYAFPGDPYADSYTQERIGKFSVKDTSIRSRLKSELERLEKSERDLAKRVKTLEKQLSNAKPPEVKRHILKVIDSLKNAIKAAQRKIADHKAEIKAFDDGKKGKYYISETLLRPGDIALSPANAQKMAGQERRVIKFMVIYEDGEGNEVKHCAQGRFMDTTASNVSPERVDVYDPDATLVSPELAWKDVKRLEQ